VLQSLIISLKCELLVRHMLSHSDCLMGITIKKTMRYVRNTIIVRVRHQIVFFFGERLAHDISEVHLRPTGVGKGQAHAKTSRQLHLGAAHTTVCSHSMQFSVRPPLVSPYDPLLDLSRAFPFWCIHYPINSKLGAN
jgi:hypothetical protein